MITTMSKIAYVGLPAHGHTNPTLPIVKTLVQHGHQVLFYNAASFETKVAPTHADFRPFPEPLPTERDLAEALQEFINMPLIISGMSRHLTDFLIAEFEREQPEIVIYDSIAMWGYVAARVNKIPQICFVTTFVLDGSKGVIGFGTLAKYILSALPSAIKLLRWRRTMAQRYGKENSGGITEYADMNIIFTSREFHPQNSFIDDRFHFVGPSFDATIKDNDFPFEHLRDGTKVYISLGTINYLNTAFYDTTFAAFADYPAQFILSVGKHTQIDQLGAIPDNFIVRHSVPQLAILQQVDAFITHGGMNSVHEGLYYGVPQLVVPSHFEQELNGKRVAQTGSGILLEGTVTVEQLRNGLDHLLSNKSYRENAEIIGRTLRAAGGYPAAVAAVESQLQT
jgi:MGT family glycosyltransferase